MAQSGSSCPAAIIFGPADLSSQSECGDVSTFRKAQKYSRETPKESSTLPPPNSAIRVTSLMRAGQTFQQATQVQTLRLCPNQDWPRHRPDKLANTQQNPAFAQLNIDRSPKPGLPATRPQQEFVLPLGVRYWSGNRHFKREPITGVQRISP